MSDAVSGGTSSPFFTPRSDQPPEKPPSVEKRVGEVTLHFFKSNRDFTAQETLTQLFTWLAPPRWIPVTKSDEGGNYYCVDAAALKTILDIDDTRARTVESQDLLREIFYRCLLHPSPQSELLLKDLIKIDPKFSREQLLAKAAEFAINGMERQRNFALGLLPKELLEQVSSTIDRELSQRLSFQGIRTDIENVLKFNPDFFEKNQLLLNALLGDPNSSQLFLDLFITHELRSLNRRAVYDLFQVWKVTPKELVLSTLQIVSKNSPSLGLRKGAQNVLTAIYQQELLEAVKKNDLGRVSDILDRCNHEAIAPHKLLKEYLTTTGVRLDDQDKAKLQSCVLRWQIARSTPEQVKELIKESARIGCDPWSLVSLLREFGENYKESLELLFRVNEALIYFDSEQFKPIKDLYTVLNCSEQKLAEAISLALEIRKSEARPENANTKAAKFELLRLVEQEALHAATELYYALIENKSDQIASIQARVAQSSYVYDFPLFLERVNTSLKLQQEKSARQEVVDQIVAIYSAMSEVPFRQHRMSPSELVKAAMVAQVEFATMTQGATLRKKEPDFRTRVVDQTRREVSFVSKSKGGGLYTFGGFKKVSDLITVRLIEGKFSVVTKIEAVLRKDVIGEKALKEWADEVRFMEELAGKEGLPSTLSVLHYTTGAGGKIHARQALQLEKFDLGSFQNFVNKETPPEKLIAYFTDIAKGLDNLHNFKEGAKTVPRVHGDLKPTNLLASSDGRAIITDLGFMGTAKQPRAIKLLYYGTCGFSAPEVAVAAIKPPRDLPKLNHAALALLDQPALDCFAIGVTIFMALKRKYPDAMKLQQENPKKAKEIKDKLIEQRDAALQALAKIKPPTAASELERIAWRLMDPTPATRLKAAQLKQEMEKLKKRFPAT